MKKTLYLILLILIVSISVIFTIQNTNQVDVRFFSWDLEMSLAYIIFLSILTGIVFSALWILINMFKYKKQIRTLKKQCKNYEKQSEIHSDTKNQKI